VTSLRQAFIAEDLGTATTAVALVAHVDGRWRLLGGLALPAAIDRDVVVRLLVGRVAEADPALAARLGPTQDLPSLTARTAAPPALGVVAATRRSLAALAAAGERAGWRVRAASADAVGPLALTGLLLRREIDAVLAGAGDPAGADERGALPGLGALVAAAAGRRPDLPVVLAGAMADQAARFEDADRPGPLLLAPAAWRGEPPGSALAALLDDLRARPDDGRRAIIRATGSLARVLDRTVEVVEVGANGGLRAVARPVVAGRAQVQAAIVADAALVPPDIDDDLVDAVLAWSTVATDRHRLRDRLRDLRASPWAEAHGEGALLRAAAARAALGRLAAATPELSALPAPDLLVAVGGAWSVAPGPAVALALADVVRRPGASQLAFDGSRLLGPLGTIDDDVERDRVVADLADDLLTPLGTVVTPAIARGGRTAGTLTVRTDDGETALELVPGGIELVDLPPGARAQAEFVFRELVLLGTRGRRFMVDVGGGLGGLLVDLRGVPLHLPERPERRRELLDAWQRALWAGLEG
jgi:hypothetical protein